MIKSYLCLLKNYPSLIFCELGRFFYFLLPFFLFFKIYRFETDLNNTIWISVTALASWILLLPLLNLIWLTAVARIYKKISVPLNFLRKAYALSWYSILPEQLAASHRALFSVSSEEQKEKDDLSLFINRSLVGNPTDMVLAAAIYKNKFNAFELAKDLQEQFRHNNISGLVPAHLATFPRVIFSILITVGMLLIISRSDSPAFPSGIFLPLSTLLIFQATNSLSKLNHVCLVLSLMSGKEHNADRLKEFGFYKSTQEYGPKLP